MLMQPFMGARVPMVHVLVRDHGTLLRIDLVYPGVSVVPGFVRGISGIAGNGREVVVDEQTHAKASHPP